MCVNFFAQYILILDADVNSEFPADTVFCVDADENVYQYDGDGKSARDILSWPYFENFKGIPLFRNFWTFLFNMNEKQSPVYQAILDAPRTQIRPPLGTNDF